MKEFKMEEYWNMMSGCEQMIYDETKKEEVKAKKAERELTRPPKNGKKQDGNKSTLGRCL